MNRSQRRAAAKGAARAMSKGGGGELLIRVAAIEGCLVEAIQAHGAVTLCAWTPEEGEDRIRKMRSALDEAQTQALTRLPDKQAALAKAQEAHEAS